MQNIFGSLLIIFMIFGCSANDKSSEQEDQAFTISMASAFASSSTISIPVNAQLVLEASTTLDPQTINEDTIYIENALHIHLPSTIRLSGTKIILDPVIYLDSNSDYSIVVTTEVLTLSGLHLKEALRIPFHSGPQIDFISPTIELSIPTGTQQVESFATIYFQFSEPISPLSLQPSQLTLYDNNNSQYVSGTFDISNALVSFSPTNKLINTHSYTIQLDTSSITDLAKNAYSGNNPEVTTFQVKTTDSPTTTLTETVPAYHLSATVNALESDQNNTLFVGSDNGVDIFTYDKQNGFIHLSNYQSSSDNIVYNLQVDNYNRRLYLATSKGSDIIDIKDLFHPTLINHFTVLNNSGQSVPVYNVTTYDGQLYLAATTYGIVDLNMTDVHDLQVIFVSENNNSNQESVYDLAFVNDGNGQYFLNASYFNRGIKSFEANGSVSPYPVDDGLGKELRNFVETYDGYAIAAGLKGVGVDYFGLYFPVEPPSYVSKVLNGMINFYGWAIVEHFGLITFDPSYGNYSTYYPLPYKINACGYTTDSSSVATLFLADDKGGIHAYEIP